MVLKQWWHCQFSADSGGWHKGETEANQRAGWSPPSSWTKPSLTLALNKTIQFLIQHIILGVESDNNLVLFWVDMQVFHVIDNNQLLLLRIGTDGRILERYDHVLTHACGCLLKLCNFETNSSGGCHILTWEAWLQSQNGFLRFPQCFDNSLIKPPKSILIYS